MGSVAKDQRIHPEIGSYASRQTSMRNVER